MRMGFTVKNDMRRTHSTPGHLSAVGDIFRSAWERSRGSISMLIVYVCVCLFLTVTLLGVVGFVSRGASMSFLGLSYVGAFQRFWLFQFITAPLMHGGVTHLLFNMLALWMLGPGVETAMGRGRYIVFSVLCALCSMLGFLLFSWGSGSIVVGYSGVIFGILVAQAMLFPNNTIAFFGFFPLQMKYAVIILGAMEYYFTISSAGGNVAHSAHLFGAVAALGYLLLLRRAEKRPEKRVPKLKRRTRRKAARCADIPKEL
jgi:rhomboid family protein